MKKCRVCRSIPVKGREESCIDCRDFDLIARSIFNDPKRLAKVDRTDFPDIGSLADHIKTLYNENNRCHYTNHLMTLPNRDKDKVGTGMVCSPDRERPSGLYSKDNIVLCMAKINVMKTDLSSAKEFYEVCKTITNYYEKKFEDQGLRNMTQEELEELIKEIQEERSKENSEEKSE